MYPIPTLKRTPVNNKMHPLKVRQTASLQHLIAVEGESLKWMALSTENIGSARHGARIARRAFPKRERHAGRRRLGLSDAAFLGFKLRGVSTRCHTKTFKEMPLYRPSPPLRFEPCEAYGLKSLQICAGLLVTRTEIQ